MPLATAGTSSWRSSPTKTERVAVARVLGPKGLAGAMRLELLTDWPERLIAGAELHLDGEEAARRVAEIQLGGGTPAIRLEGVEDRDAAAALHGRYLEVDARALPEGEYYWHELVGLRVEDESGTSLGTLVEIFRAGGNEVYRVDGDAGDRLLPALRRVVRRIDLDAGLMVVRPDEELD